MKNQQKTYHSYETKKMVHDKIYNIEIYPYGLFQEWYDDLELDNQSNRIRQYEKKMNVIVAKIKSLNFTYCQYDIVNKLEIVIVITFLV